MMSKVNFAISGCGHISFRHALAASEFGNLVAVCDEDVSKSKSLASRFGCKSYSSPEVMLREQSSIDVVSICSPNYMHAPQSIECLQKGFHVICEKPMAIKVSDAEEMIAQANTSGKQLFIVKQLRYNPYIIFIKNLLLGGTLGSVYSFHINCFWNRPEPYYMGWKGRRHMDGGTLFTQFSHYIDLLLWLFGEVSEVQFMLANLAHPYIDFEDVGIVNFKMKSGCIGNLNYTVNAFERNAENSITIFSENGSLKLSGGLLDVFEDFRVKGVYKVPHFPRLHKDYSHFKVYENAVNALTGQEHNVLSADESIASIRLIEKIYNQSGI